MKKICFQKLLVFCWLSFGLSLIGIGQEEKADSVKVVSIEEKYKGKYTAFPYVAYAPETEYEFGAFLLRQFKPKSAGKETRPSFVEFWAAYTVLHQYDIGIKHTIFLPGEKWFLKGIINYERFPEKFYGIGDDMPDIDEREVEWEAILIEQQLLRNLGNKMFAGLQFRYNNMLDVDFEKKEGVENIKEGLDRVYGVNGGVNSAFGLTYKWDKRDHVLTPTKGFYLELSSFFYNKVFGSDFTFNTLILDARKYFDFSSDKDGGSVLAFQGQMINSFGGDVPFRQQALFGGKRIMRGFYQGRYRDNNLTAIQAEYRQHIFWRIGATAFVGTGNVMTDLSEFDMSRFKAAAGAGFRLNINKNDKANLRVDYGIGTDGASGLYMTFGEAF